MNAKLGLLHTFAHILSLAADGSQNGYEIASEKYFALLNNNSKGCSSPVARSSLCEARYKIPWQAFEFVMQQLAALTSKQAGLWLGHRLVGVDGVQVKLPASREIKSHYPLRNIQGEHYPKARITLAVDLQTQQPLAANIDRTNTSELSACAKLLPELEPGSVLVMDRGFQGAWLWQEILNHQQHFINRVRCTLGRDGLVQRFLRSGKSEQLLSFRSSPNEKGIDVRLIKGPKINDGGQIVIATSLLDAQTYPRKKILNAYSLRWREEVDFLHLKHLLHIESFHARKLEGVLQEVFAHLIWLSVAKLLAWQASQLLGSQQLAKRKINFKATYSIILRYFHLLTGLKTSKRPWLDELLEKIHRHLCPIQPGRCNPRLSRQPESKWIKARRQNAHSSRQQVRRWKSAH